MIWVVHGQPWIGLTKTLLSVQHRHGCVAFLLNLISLIVRRQKPDSYQRLP